MDSESKKPKGRRLLNEIVIVIGDIFLFMFLGIVVSTLLYGFTHMSEKDKDFIILLLMQRSH